MGTPDEDRITNLEASCPVVVGAVCHVDLQDHSPGEVLFGGEALLALIAPVHLRNLLLARLASLQSRATRLVQSLVLAGDKYSITSERCEK